jgi:hypothetical protein
VSELSQRHADQILALISGCDVGGNDKRPPSEGLYIRRGSLEGFASSARQHDTGTVLGKYQTGCPADSGAASSYDGDPLFEREA